MESFVENLKEGIIVLDKNLNEFLINFIQSPDPHTNPHYTKYESTLLRTNEKFIFRSTGTFYNNFLVKKSINRKKQFLKFDSSLMGKSRKHLYASYLFKDTSAREKYNLLLSSIDYGEREAIHTSLYSSARGRKKWIDIKNF